MLVTAASAGLGYGAAQALAREGARLAVVARRPGPLAEAAARLRQEGAPQVEAIAADLDRPEERARLWEEVTRRLGPPWGAVVNVGNPVPGAITDPADPAWQDGWAKLQAVLDLDRRAHGAMAAAGGGVVVNVLSRTAQEPQADLLISSVVRAGLYAFAKAMARPWAADGVRVLSLLPGYTRTPGVEAGLRQRAQEAGRPLEAVLAEEAAAIPLGRLGDLESFGRLVAFLASPACDYLTGSAIRYDGGAAASP